MQSVALGQWPGGWRAASRRPRRRDGKRAPRSARRCARTCSSGRSMRPPSKHSHRSLPLPGRPCNHPAASGGGCLRKRRSGRGPRGGRRLRRRRGRARRGRGRPCTKPRGTPAPARLRSSGARCPPRSAGQPRGRRDAEALELLLGWRLRRRVCDSLRAEMAAQP